MSKKKKIGFAILGTFITILIIVLVTPGPSTTPPAAPIVPPAAETPTPVPESYPMVDINSYAAGSAERAFAEFLTAWKNENWARMAEFTQLTWTSSEVDPAETLGAWYDFKDLLGAEIVEVNEGSDVMVDITATIYYRFTQVESKSITARVICETAPYTPDPEGKWGVNPVSTLKEE